MFVSCGQMNPLSCYPQNYLYSAKVVVMLPSFPFIFSWSCGWLSCLTHLHLPWLFLKDYLAFFPSVSWEVAASCLHGVWQRKRAFWAPFQPYFCNSSTLTCKWSFAGFVLREWFLIIRNPRDLLGEGSCQDSLLAALQQADHKLSPALWNCHTWRGCSQQLIKCLGLFSFW